MAKSTLIAHISREHALAAAATLPLAEESTLGQHYDTIRKPHLEFKCCFCDFKSTSKKSFQVRLEIDLLKKVVLKCFEPIKSIISGAF